MSNYEASRYDYDGSNIVGIEGIATATIVPWSDSSPPSGFLECNGSAVSRSTYADLFAVIGTTYGSGNGSTTFNVPDLQDNVPVGKSGTKNLGSTGGANTVQKTGNISGSTANATLSEAQLASHKHFTAIHTGTGSINDAAGRANNNPAGSSNAMGNTGSGSGHSHNMSANFTGDSNSVIQPYITLIYIIKT